MPRQGLSFEEYQAAADAIYAQGHFPTVDRTLEALGRGSRTTHSSHQKRWKKENAEPVTKPGPQDPLTLHLERIGQQLREEAALKIADIKEEAAAALAEAHQLQAVAEEAGDRARKEMEESSKKLNDLAAAKELLLLDNNQLRRELDMLTERHTGVQANYEEVAGELAAREKIYELNLAEIKKLHERHIQTLTQTHQRDYNIVIKEHETKRSEWLIDIDLVKDKLYLKNEELKSYYNLALVLQQALADNINFQIQFNELYQANKRLDEQAQQLKENYQALQHCLFVEVTQRTTMENVTNYLSTQDLIDQLAKIIQAETAQLSTRILNELKIKKTKGMEEVNHVE
jgi:hypothetical protein